VRVAQHVRSYSLTRETNKPGVYGAKDNEATRDVEGKEGYRKSESSHMLGSRLTLLDVLREPLETLEQTLTSRCTTVGGLQKTDTGSIEMGLPWVHIP
jgi:hypothetical protein